MIPYAEDVLVSLHKQFPDMVFEWDNKPWGYGDTTPCSLFIAFRTNPSDKFELRFDSGIESSTSEQIAHDIIDYTIPKLK